MPVVMTPSEMNRLNKTFWAAQKVLMDQRVQRRELVLVAMAFISEEAKRHVPVGHRRTFEKALQDAEEVVDIIGQPQPTEIPLGKAALVEAARKAGSAPKADALTRLIRRLVAKRPSLSLQELVSTLESLKGLGIIHDVGAGLVWFTNRGKQLKDVPLSGLRGRLSRAKAEFRRTQSR